MRFEFPALAFMALVGRCNSLDSQQFALIHELLPHWSQDSSEKGLIEALLLNNGTIEHFHEVALSFLEVAQHKASPILEQVRFLQAMDSDGTPCASQEACDALAERMNACANMRITADGAYRTFLSIVKALNLVMSVLCGCIFVGPVHLCALKNFPYTCTFPYQIYAEFTGLTSSVFEAEKILSSICANLGDIASAIPV